MFPGISRLGSFLSAAGQSLARYLTLFARRVRGDTAPLTPENPPPLPEIATASIIWAAKEEKEQTLAQIERYAPTWKASPAYLVMKPDHGLIVSLQRIEHEDQNFVLVLSVEQSVIAPEGFDPQIPIRLTCPWNQLYMSLCPDEICAPYGFRLQFGAQGVQRIREGLKTGLVDSVRINGIPHPQLLSACFRPNYGCAQSPPSDEAV